MLRYVAAIVAALLLVSGGLFVWKSRAAAEDPIPSAPAAAAARPSAYQPRARNPLLAEAPTAPEKSREQQRFARADKDKDGHITLEELFQPRRKAFAKLDANNDGRLAFDEWASSTNEKFGKADSDRSGWLTPAEYETTKPKVKPKPKCGC
jgi:hypothetical protein